MTLLTVEIANDIDDGHENVAGAAWDQRRRGYDSIQMRFFLLHEKPSSDFDGGLRFRALGLASGVTINSAWIEVAVNATGADHDWYVYGDDVTDASTFSDSSLPSAITRTTAFTQHATGGTTGLVNIDVLGIVQEIAALGAIDDMRFSIVVDSAETYRASEIADFNEYATPTSHAVLNIDYTAGGGTINNRTLNDEATVNDAQTRMAQMVRNLIDTLNVNDLIMRSPLFFRTLNDSVDITDSLTRSTVLLYAVVLNDAITVTDETKRYVDFLRLLTDQIDINDAISRIVQTGTIVSRILQASVDVNDQINVQTLLTILRVLQDSITVNDTLVRFLDITRLLGDSVDVTDSVTREVINNFIERTLRDSVDITDELLRTIIGSDVVQAIVTQLLKRDISFDLAMKQIKMELKKL